MATSFQPRSTSPQETALRPYRAWTDEEEDEFSAAEKDYAGWISELAQGEELFKKHVYDNPEAEEYDFRQHRAKLYHLLAQGEALALKFLSLSRVHAAEVRKFVALLDERLEGLRAVLRAWHGSLEEQSDVPDSFKRGLEDLTQGRTVEMERALSEAPASAQ